MSKFVNKMLDLALDLYEKDGQTWLLAKDVSDFLGYSKATDMTRLITFEENVCTQNMRIGNTNTNVLLINEYALYEILCKVKRGDATRYDKARNFQKWVFQEVLPSVRHNGGYIAGDTEEEVLVNVKKVVRSISDKLGVTQDLIKYLQTDVNNLNNIIAIVESHCTDALDYCNEFRFMIANQYQRRNGVTTPVETMTPTQQEEIFRKIAIEYPEYDELWDNVMKTFKAFQDRKW